MTLMQELGVVRGKGSRPLGIDEEMGTNVTWGGNASSTATDLEEQERLLMKMFKPHKVSSQGGQTYIFLHLFTWILSCLRFPSEPI